MIGVSRDGPDKKPLFFHDHGRYAELMAATSNLSTSRRTPSLVSFVGQAGAGKSTLIKLLILLKAPAGVTPQCPVVGRSGGEVPTSEDVHLYLDPSSTAADAPILYADCEGLDGGEREPMATAYRMRRRSNMEEDSSEEEESTLHTRYELQWAKSRTERTRNFAVSRFYPRLLFTFSDVVIFVHRNPRVIESVLEQLIKWAAAALETSNNQPILPYAIIVLNACPHDIDPALWDVDFATKSLLMSLSETVDQNATFAQCAKFWRERGREIKSIEELMLCYYSSVRVVRLPSDLQPNRVLDQVQKLYKEMEQACEGARERKSGLRMLLDAGELRSYLGDAFDHYSRSLDVPFDFVQASFVHNPIPFNFGGNILKLAIAMTKEERVLEAPVIFNKLGTLVASCIMLDAVRHNIPGTASHIFPQYLDYLDETLQSFCDRYWPCEYIERGITPASLQYDLSYSQHWNTLQSTTIGYRCVNVRTGHEAKGHQNNQGRMFARGAYYSKFSFENNREEFFGAVYFSLERLLNQLADFNRHGESQMTTAASIHRKNVQEFFHKSSIKSESLILQRHSVCWCCLFEAPEHLLSCGHVLCTPCLKAYGRAESRHIVRIYECPFEPHGRCQPRSLYIKPEEAGTRILVLDDGGVRSIIQLEILRLLEVELNGKLPIQLFFDIIVGKGSGSVVALSLLNDHWTVDEYITSFMRIIKSSFASRNRRKTSRIRDSTAKYQSKALEQSLRETFTENQTLFRMGIDGRVGTAPKVAVPVVSSTGKTTIFCNYIRQSDKDEAARENFKTWEAARSAMAHPSFFKPFKHRASSQVYINQEHGASPMSVAQSEFNMLRGTSSAAILDIVVSLGTGLSIGASASPAGLENRMNSSKTTRSSLMGIVKPRTVVRFDQQCERTWNDYVQSLTPDAAKKYRRLNIDCIDLPAFDDAEKMESLRYMVRSQITTETIETLAFRLIAQLFYLERTGEVEVISGNELFLQYTGELLCRIPDGTPAMAEIGRLLKDGKFRSSKLVIQEQLCETQHFDIPPEVIDDMIHDLQFCMPELKIRVSPKAAELNATLRFANREEYSISGFPRLLIGRGAQPSRSSIFNFTFIIRS